MLKVNLDVLKSWITKRLQELLGIEDDVVIEFVFNQLEDKVRKTKQKTSFFDILQKLVLTFSLFRILIQK